MLEEGAAFLLEEVDGVFLGESSVEHLLNGDADGGSGGATLAPVEDQFLGLELCQHLSADFLNDVGLLVAQFGTGPGEDVEDSQFLFADVLANVALLFLAEFLGEIHQLLEELLDAEGSTVVFLDDQAVHLVLIDAVRPGDGLHEGVAAHRFVEIQGRATRRVEARQPHCAYKDETEVVVGVFELGLEIFLCHPNPTGKNVKATLLHLLHFVLARGHHHGHIGLSEIRETLLQFDPFGRAHRVVPDLVFDSRSLRLPFGADFFEHPQGREFVDGDDHGLALIAPVEKMVDDILGYRIEPVAAGDEVVAFAEDFLELLLLIVVQARLVDDLVDLLVQVWIGDPQFRSPVLVVERHRGTVIDRLLEVVDADVVESEESAGSVQIIRWGKWE